MSRLLHSLLVLALAAPALAQQAQTTPNQQPKPAPTTTLRTGTRLVVVDVVVTDQRQHPVHNLKASDFTLRENNVLQVVKSFEEHTAPTPAEIQKIEPMPKMPTGVFTNFTPAPALANGPVNILLLDRLNTALQDQSRVRAQLLSYLKQAKPGTPIAIFGLTTQLILLQGFTDDPVLLREVLDKKLKLKASLLIDDSTGGGSDQETMSAAINENMPDPDFNPALNSVIAYASLLESQISTAQLQDRARYTLDAMNALARYLVGIPGRKNLIWFSGSFPLNILPDAAPSVPNTEFINVSDFNGEYRETVSLLSRAQVAVYPVDARGVTILPTSSAASSGSQYVGHPTAPGRAISAFMDSTFEENHTMLDMAEQTGGHAFINTNDLTEAVADAIDTGSNYYTLTYTPTNGNWKGDFRKIQVQLQQQGLELSYRRGYYADDPDSPPSILAKEASGRAVAAPMPLISDYGAMHLALMHAGPEPAQIVFSTQILPISTSTEDTLVPGNEGSKDLKGPYRRYSLNFGVDPRAINFTTTPDGMHHGAIEFVTFVYDAEGKLINALGNPIRADFNHTLYLNALQHGIPFHQEVSVPAKGEYFLRIAVHDLQGDHVGALEVPISSVHNLPPATAQASAPASTPK